VINWTIVVSVLVGIGIAGILLVILRIVAEGEGDLLLWTFIGYACIAALVGIPLAVIVYVGFRLLQ
jgi:hypothetical protein